MLAVRWLHVLAAAVVLGGATLTWWLFRQGATADSAATTSAATALQAAVAYERWFWAGMGVLVMTGVGNLGSLAPYVPAPGTRWGTAFAAKVLLVVALLALSLVRTLIVHRCRRAGTMSDRGVDALRVGYAATALSLGALVALAEVLAHG